MSTKRIISIALVAVVIGGVVAIVVSAFVPGTSDYEPIVVPQSSIDDESRFVLSMALKPTSEIYYRRMIYSFASDGTDIQQITPVCERNEDVSRWCEDFYPSVSPDGKRIAFSRFYNLGSDTSRTGLYTVNMDGTDLKFLVPGGHQPSWSPDGSQIAFVKNVENSRFLREDTRVSPLAYGGDLYVINADGTNERFVVGGRAEPIPDSDEYLYNGFLVDAKSVDVRNPSWSPDGTQFAFRSNRNLYTVNIDGTGLRRLVGMEDFSKEDTEKLADEFVAENLYYFEERGTGGLHREGGPDSPAWSPDGETIAFHVLNRVETRKGSLLFRILSFPIALLPNNSYNNEHSVYTIRADGTNLQRVGRGMSPSWSPDGERILFLSKYNSGSGSRSLNWFYMNADDGGEVRRVTRRSAVTVNQNTYFVDRHASAEDAQLARQNFHEAANFSAEYLSGETAYAASFNEHGSANWYMPSE